MSRLRAEVFGDRMAPEMAIGANLKHFKKL